MLRTTSQTKSAWENRYNIERDATTLVHKAATIQALKMFTRTPTNARKPSCLVLVGATGSGKTLLCQWARSKPILFDCAGLNDNQVLDYVTSYFTIAHNPKETLVLDNIDAMNTAPEKTLSYVRKHSDVPVIVTITDTQAHGLYKKIKSKWMKPVYLCPNLNLLASIIAKRERLNVPKRIIQEVCCSLQGDVRSLIRFLHDCSLFGADVHIRDGSSTKNLFQATKQLLHQRSTMETARKLFQNVPNFLLMAFLQENAVRASVTMEEASRVSEHLSHFDTLMHEVPYMEDLYASLACTMQHRRNQRVVFPRSLAVKKGLKKACTKLSGKHLSGKHLRGTQHLFGSLSHCPYRQGLA